MILSQAVNGTEKNLFRVRTRSHGTEINSNYKIAIADLKRGSDVAGSDYGTFSLRVLVNNPKENNDNEIVEEFTNLNLDENSKNFCSTSSR